MEKWADGSDRRQRQSLTLVALLPAALGLLGTLCSAGRLSWLGPILTLPVGLWLCRVWRELGERGLPRSLETAFGKAFGRLAQLLYFLWGLFLLRDGAEKLSHRMERLLPGAEWYFLLTAAAVCLWLMRKRGIVLARMGRGLFLLTAAALTASLALAAPGLDWKNLWPPEKGDAAGLFYSALLCLSLAGYGVFALCISCREKGKSGWDGAIWGSVGLAWLLLTVVGTFGPGLAAKLDEPFLMALQGVEVPGAFRRGEAALAAVLTLADFALLSLLGRGCESMWEKLAPESWRWGGNILPVLAILAAGVLKKDPWAADWLPVGNLIFGVVIPALTVLGEKMRGRKKD